MENESPARVETRSGHRTSPQAKAIRSQATLTSRSHTLTMAMHAPLSQFLARLDTDLGAGTGGEFLAATGRRLVASHVLPEEEFARSGQPSDSDLGSLLRTLHSLGAAVDWAGAVTTGHASKIEFFASVGLTLADAANVYSLTLRVWC